MAMTTDRCSSRRVTGCPENTRPTWFAISTPGACWRASGVLARDEFDDEHAPIGQLNILTDGDWAWPSDLSYYVDKYAVELPGDFVRNAAGRSWVVPELSREELVQAEEEFLST